MTFYTIRPISDRTPFGGDQRPNPFKAKWSDTLRLLRSELALLDAADVVFEIDVVDDSQIRLDGMLRADAKVRSGAVRIAFDSKHGPLTYATDRFVGNYFNDPPDWQINVRAIALGLEALRKIERYGIVKRDEQYLGFKQLGAGRAMPASHMTKDEAGSLLYKVSKLSIYQPPEEAYRRARFLAHPDRHAGDRTLWDQVEQAGAVLGYLS